MKKLFLTVLVMFCIIGTEVFAINCYANDSVSIFMDCGKGSCLTADGFDTINAENSAKVGSTVSTVWNFVEDPTSIDQDFVCWNIYDKKTGTLLASSLTTEQVNNYVVPNSVINIVAQWTPRAGYPVNNNAYFAFWDGEGEPCYDMKISIIHDGICYSGYGFVSIPESIYSTWSGTITYRLEPLNGVYHMYDGKWTNEACEYEGTAKEFQNWRYRNSYVSVSLTGKGSDHVSPRRKVNDWYYQASFIAPEVSVLSTTPAEQVISDHTVIPATYTVRTEVYQSGASYDAALTAAQSSFGTSNIVVMDIELKDENGLNVNLLSDYVDVRVDVPSTYVIQPGNTVVVYYLNDSGILEECETVYHEDDPNNRYVTFKTNHFSTYVLAEKEPVKEPEVTPEAEPEATPVPEESETVDTEVKDSIGAEEKEKEETSQIEEKVEAEDVTKEDTKTEEASKIEEVIGENTKDDKMAEGNGGNDAKDMIIWIAGAAVLVVFVVVVLRFIKNKKNKG